MKTLDPIGLFRYLNPRASGLIVFKGDGASAAEVDASVQAGVADAKSYVDTTVGTASESGTTEVGGGSFTTPVVNSIGADGELVQTGGETVNYGGGTADVTSTVKGDTEKLIGGQSETKDLINKRFDTFTPTTVVNQTIDTSDLAKQADLTSGFATSASNQADILKDTGAMQLTLADMGQKQDAGFASVGTELGKANTGIGELKTGQGTIVDDISDLSTAQETGFSALGTKVDTGFTAADKAITEGFAEAQTDRDTLSSDVLGGQGALQEYLEGMSGRADTYYEGLSGNQNTLIDNLGGLQSNFTDFRDTYDANTNLANQTRAELQDTVVGGFNRLRGDIGTGFQDTRSDIGGVEAAVDQSTGKITSAQANASTDYTKAIRELSSGLGAATQDDAAQQGDILERLDTVRQVLTNENVNISDQMRDQYTKLATSFDAEGRLIRESVDQGGNITRRAMDDQSNVLMAEFNSQGGLLNQSVINVNRLLKQMNELGYTNANVVAATGDQSPQNLVNRRAAIESGIMGRDDAFFNTFE